MKQEDKELLLRDLFARLPYGVKCENFNHVYGKNVFKVTDIRENGYICGTINNQHCWAVFNPLELKPYLFPLSSMTEEQKEELFFNYIHNDIYFDDFNDYFLAGELWHDICVSMDVLPELIDWLNKNHFDYRGLIDKGLAIDATNLNIY